jgi:hypothetical protein
MIAVENGPGGIDLKLEAELAELPEDEAAAYRDGGESALDEIAGRLRDALDLITFFTAGEKETRAWTLRRGQTAIDAAGTIHTDIARGFIRAQRDSSEFTISSYIGEEAKHGTLCRRQSLPELDGLNRAALASARERFPVVLPAGRIRETRKDLPGELAFRRSNAAARGLLFASIIFPPGNARLDDG